MSSEESVTTTSSRLRQFGLYRNIDTRTEEFLKLSRKRQIRQGCACAAVSTAITVTVVVSVLIALEYGFHADFVPIQQPKHKPNWISMLNDSEANFDVNQQRTNIKSSVIVPLLIKALKQNRILEKVIEEYSSHPPVYEEETTDIPLQRNVFTDARNWMRMPPARMYAIEYKTSPIVFFKSRNIDEFSKARKMMDSQRVTNYLDRMMNDKATYGTTKQTNSAETHNTVKKMSSTVNPKRAINRFERIEQPQQTTTKNFTTKRTQKLNDCKCPSNMGDILQKLIFSIQKLFQESREDKKHASKDCAITASSPKEQTKTFIQTKPFAQTTVFVTSRRTTTAKRSPKITTYNNSPLDIFQTKSLPIVSSEPKFPKLNEKIIKNKTKPSGLVGFSSYGKLPRKNYATDKVIETTTQETYLEVPYYKLYKTVTTTKPMIPVPIEKSQNRAPTVEHFLKIKQNDHINTLEYIHYDTAEINTKTTTGYDDLLWNDETETNKKKTLAKFLSKYKESQKNNEKFEDNHLDIFDDYHLDYPTMRTYNLNNVLTQKKTVDDDPKKYFKTKTIEPQVNNATKIEKANFKIKAAAATKDASGSVIRDLTDWKIVPVNITYGSIRIPNDSNEKVISVVPEHRPPFLEIRRNEGRQDEIDYDVNPNPNRDFFD